MVKFDIGFAGKHFQHPDNRAKEWVGICRVQSNTGRFLVEFYLCTAYQRGICSKNLCEIKKGTSKMSKK